jgi:HEAT repeat protein
MGEPHDSNPSTPTVFISYVRENTDQVKRLVNSLRAKGVAAWLDTDNLKPGYRWPDEIRRAIESGGFFLACFSPEYTNKTRSYMNEELIIAIEELRRRPVDRAWFIPVLLAECEVPDRTIGAGETLRSLQFVPLYEDWGAGIARLLLVIDPTSARLTELVRELDSSSARARIRALDNLGSMGAVAGGFVSKILQLLEDDNETVRAAAAEALGKIGNTTEEVVRRLLTLVQRRDYRPYPSVHAERSLVRLGEAAVPTLKQVMIENADKPHDYDRPFFWAARNALVKIGKPAVSALMEAALVVEGRAKAEIIDGLGEIGEASAEAVPLLIEYSNSNEGAVKASSVGALGKIGDSRAVEPLIALLGDPYWNATEALGRIGDRRAVPHLIEALAHPKDHGGAAIALGMLGDASAVPSLIEVLKDRGNSTQKRALAIFGLGLLGEASVAAVPYIVGASNEEEFQRYPASYGETVRIALQRIDGRG